MCMSTFLFLCDASAVSAFIACSGLAIVDHLQKLDPASLSGWEGISFKLFLILALAVSLSLNIALAKWVASRLLKALEDVSSSSERLIEATKRCNRHQGVVVD